MNFLSLPRVGRNRAGQPATSRAGSDASSPSSPFSLHTWLLAAGFALATLAGCGGGDAAPGEEGMEDSVEEAAVQPTEEELTLELTAEGISTEKYRHVKPVNPVYRWNALALDAARSLALNDARAARLYAMLNVAMYDAVNGIVSQTSNRRHHALVPIKGAPKRGSTNAAASAAARAILVHINPAQASVYDAQHAADLAAVSHGDARRDGAAWGASVAAKVIQNRTDDGSQGNETRAANLETAGQYRQNWSNMQFRNMKPFAIDKASRYLGSGPPALNSQRYAKALREVMELGDANNGDKAGAANFTYWASGNGSSQPPGEWIKVALMVSQKECLSLSDGARLMALLGMAMADTVAPTYSTKNKFFSWRPVSAIHEADRDGNAHTESVEAWVPRGGNGTSPEYFSGHSTFAGAGTSVLRGFFCEDDIAFTLDSDDTATGARRYRSFSQAEAEAGRSRIYGGLHFQFSNEDAMEAGRGVASEILANSLLRTSGETHRQRTSKRCPK